MLGQAISFSQNGAGQPEGFVGFTVWGFRSLGIKVEVCRIEVQGLVLRFRLKVFGHPSLGC